MNIAISIIVPVYNSEKYIDKCLESLVNQTLNNIEIIIVNDNSNDNSLLKINRYVDIYDNIILINKKTNEGVSKARNDALRIAKGKYILFVDSDDTIDCSACNILYNTAIKNDIDIIMFNFKYVYLNNNQVSSKTNLIDNKVYNSEYMIKEILTTRNNVQGYIWNKFYRKELLISNEITFREDIKLYEDYLFNIETFLVSKTIKYLDLDLYYYLQHPNSSIRKIDIQNTKNVSKIINTIKINLEKNNLCNIINDEFLYFSSNLKIINIIDILKANISKEEKIKNIDIIINGFSKNEKIFISKNYSFETRILKKIIIKILCKSNFKSKIFIIYYSIFLTPFIKINNIIKQI